MLTPAKHKAVLANGRDRKPPITFEETWTKVQVSFVISPQWRNLTASAKDVLLICLVKNGNAARKSLKDKTGKPTFSFTYIEAKKLLNMPTPTFKRALSELQTAGFIGISSYGGILDGKGRAAKYHLSSDWKTWQPPIRDLSNMKKARASRKISCAKY